MSMSPIEFAQLIGITIATEDAEKLAKFFDSKMQEAYKLGYHNGFVAGRKEDSKNE